MSKKLICLAICIVCLTSFCMAVSACDTEGYENLGSKFELYDEGAFLQELSKGGDNRVCFAEDGKLKFGYIVYPDGLYTQEENRNNAELKGAIEFFISAIEKMTGDNILAVEQSDYDLEQGKAVILATDKSLNVGKGGYTLDINDNAITISAKDYEGLYGALYAFLEDELGCMFVSRDYDYIPEAKTIWLDKGTKEHTPSMEWRYVYAYEAELRTNEDGTKQYNGWNSKLRLNGSGMNDWYNWVHTSFTYVSPDEYFDEHPEYFSLYRGKRTYQQGPVSGQLCWANEDVYKIISEKVLQEMRDNPDKHIWDISQMDTWESRGDGCACDKCKAIDDREGSPIGSILTFINRLADEVAKEFPDNYISTLAYNYSAEPPKNIKPRDNVIIKLCLMPGDCASDYATPTSKHSRQANEIVTGWSKVAKHIVIWDYNIDFHNYLMPFPILDRLEENNDFYLDNNVYGIFHQMSADKGGDNAELNSYVFARLMWNREVDVQKIFDKYLTVYYEDAAPYIAQYYSDLDKRVIESGQELYIYAKPWQYLTTYLSPDAIDGYLQMFAKAEQAVKGNEEVLARVKKAKLGVLFAKATQFSADTKGRKQALEEFVSVCKANNITSLIEGEQNGEELAVFYDSTMAEIKAMPFIIIAMVIGCLLIIGTVVIIVLSIIHKKKYGSILLWKKKENNDTKDDYENLQNGDDTDKQA